MLGASLWTCESTIRASTLTIGYTRVKPAPGLCFPAEHLLVKVMVSQCQKHAAIIVGNGDYRQNAIVKMPCCAVSYQIWYENLLI